MKEYTFDVGGGETQDDRHKCHWPHGLVINMGRYVAYDMIKRLVNQLENNEDNIQIYECGQLIKEGE